MRDEERGMRDGGWEWGWEREVWGFFGGAEERRTRCELVARKLACAG